MKRMKPLIVCAAILMILVFSVSAVNLSLLTKQTPAVRKPLLSASDTWSMGSGWMDCSTDRTVCFENTTDTAGPNINNTLIDGSKGFSIRFAVDFLDPSLQTTADMTLRLNANTMSYFFLRITGIGEEAMFQADYCDNGTWSTAVPLVTGMHFTGSRLYVQIDREAAHDSLVFSLFDENGQELMRRSASSTVWAGTRFLDRSDLEVLFKPIEGYGLFRISGYEVGELPDDGVEPPLSASDVWNLGTNWRDDSTVDSVVISNVIANAGPSFFKEHIKAGEGFSLGFLYTGVSDYTTADVTLRLTSNNNVYLRMLVTQNSGTALVDVNFYDGANWTPLASTGWLAGVGQSYRVTLEHGAGSDGLQLILTKPDGSLIGSWNILNAVCTNGSFFSASDLEPLVATCGDYGLFSIADFSLRAPAVDAANWSMGANWKGEYAENGEYRITNVIENAGPNFYRKLIDGTDSFRLGFLYTGISDYTTADVTLRLTSNNNVYLRMLATQNNGTALVDVNFFDGANWTSLATTGWVADAGKSYHVYLSHEAGSDAMTLTLKKTDGSVFFTSRIENPACTNASFFSASPLEALVTTCGDYGIFSLTGFGLEKPQSTSALWTLGSGWTDANGYDAPAIRNTTDSGAAPAFWTETIDGSAGVIIDFDFEAAVREMQTTAEFVLRQTKDNSHYLRMVITARGTQEAIVETSYFDGANWTALDSTGWLSNACINGRYHVRLAHQAGAAETTLTLTASDGTKFYEKTFASDAFTDQSFWKTSFQQALFNPIPGYGCFTISGFGVQSYPAEKAETDLWKLGAGWSVYRDGEGIYLAKEDRQQTEAVYTVPINGQDGFKVSFDISFASTETSSCSMKLRVPLEQEIYLFARVKGDNNQTILEAQAYDSTAENEWTASLLSASASRWTANNGVVTVHLERQAMSETIHFYAVDKLSGDVLIDERFESERLSAARYLDYRNLEWSFGTDAGSPGFTIKNFTVDSFEADPVVVTAVEIVGSAQVMTGEVAGYRAQIMPENATVKSCIWKVDGKQVSTSAMLNYLFVSAGEYEVTLTVTDYSGNTFTKSMTVSVTEPPVIYAVGDLNGDGSVDAVDAQLLADHLTGKVPLTDEQLSRADMNGDGTTDISDIYEILSRKESEKQ